MTIKLLAAATALVIAAPVAAQTTVVTKLDGSQGMAAPASELGTGSTITITSSTALSSDGSLEFNGDRGRVLNGNNYTPNMNYGLANSLVSLTGDYLVLNGGTGGIQSPAFRVYVQDGAVRSELVWEAAYNGGYTLGTAASVTAAGLFHQYIGSGTNKGDTLVQGTGTYVFHTLADWGDLYSPTAYVSAFGVGFGSGAGAAFHALADNVVLNTDTTSRGYDFAAAPAAAVPEVATWAMMIAGFGLAGVALRRRRTTVAFA